MAKGRPTASFSHLLYQLGKAIHFDPVSAFAPPQSEPEEKKWEKPFFAYRLKMKTALAKMCEQSFFLGLYSAFIRSLFTTRVRAFGALFFSCGFLQILSYFLGGYLSFAAGDESNLIFGVTLIFLTLLSSFTRGDVKDVLKKSFLYRSVLDPLLDTERWEFPTGRGGDHFFLMLLIGALLAFFAVVFTPVAVLSVLLLVALILLVFYLPEAGLIAVGFGFFFVSFRVTAFLTVLTLISFLCKCAVGRRSLVFSSWDWVVFASLFPLLFSDQSRLTGLVLAALYLLCPGLLRTLAGVRRFLTALTAGGVFASVMMIARYALETFFEKVFLQFPGVDELLFFGTQVENLVPLAMACPLAVGLFQSGKKTTQVFVFPLVFLIFLAAVFCGESVLVWISLLIALAFQNMMTNRFSLIWYTVLGLVVVTCKNLIPPAWLRDAFAFLGFTSEEKTGESILSILGVGNVLGILILGILLGYFIYLVIRFARTSTRPKAFPGVRGAVGSVVAFLVLTFGGAVADERAPVFFILLLALPRVSYVCSKREEIRLPY